MVATNPLLGVIDGASLSAYSRVVESVGRGHLESERKASETWWRCRGRDVALAGPNGGW